MKTFKTSMLLALAMIMPAMTTAQNSAEATKILDKTYELFQQSNGVKLSFRISSVESNGKRHLLQSGIALIKGNKFKLDSSDMEVWFDGKTQWTLVNEIKEVNISEPTIHEVASISPLALLGMYKSDFRAGAPTTKTINGRSASVIALNPNSQQSDYKQVVVAIDNQSHAIMEVELTMKDGTKNLIEVSDYNANNNFADATFVFNKATRPNVTIVDLR